MKTIKLLLIALFFSFNAFAQLTQPGAPLSGNSSNCTPPNSENCSGGSTVVTSFTGATLRSGSANTVGAVYSFYNVTSVSGQQINATITIDATSNVSMSGSNFNFDDDLATDQAGNSISSFFAPRITAANNLTTTDQRGYVQFTIKFYLENGTAGQQYPADFTTIPPFGGLTGLNYIHYDIDGSTVGAGGWFRETGVIQNIGAPVINADASTELTAYNYTDGVNWKGFAGSVFERTGVSRCSQVTAAASFATPQTQVTFRMGYDYNYNGTSFNSQPTRQYGSRFGCFTFPQRTTLPVTLLSFNGAYKNNAALLNWTAENQISFDHYEIERSTNGTNFSSIAAKTSLQNNTAARENYQHMDDLSIASGNVFFYRLKMVDADGTFKYSGVIVIRKDQKSIVGITISPNPIVTGGMATVRFEATTRSTVEFKVVDMAGRVVLKQQNNVTEGTNSIAITNLDRLQPGMYMLQMNDGSAVNVTKFTIAH
jgi:Secretion system C-terminal sorting domain